MKQKKTRILLPLLFGLFLCSCSSDGEKAAKEVINAAKRGDFEQTKELMIQYGDSLEGQDYIDFCEALEKAGILY